MLEQHGQFARKALHLADLFIDQLNAYGDMPQQLACVGIIKSPPKTHLKDLADIVQQRSDHQQILVDPAILRHNGLGQLYQ